VPGEFPNKITQQCGNAKGRRHARGLEGLIGVKLRNTQQEQMSSAVRPRTDVGLARPQKLRRSNVMELAAEGAQTRPPGATSKTLKLLYYYYACWDRHIYS
jgi:hypothetical protein